MKKPRQFRSTVTVEAMQWDGTPASARAIIRWVRQLGGQARFDTAHARMMITPRRWGNGYDSTVRLGDWVVWDARHGLRVGIKSLFDDAYTEVTS